MTQVDPSLEMKWGTIQATLVLDGLTLIRDDDANKWKEQFCTVLTRPARFPFWDDTGVMVDITDNRVVVVPEPEELLGLLGAAIYSCAGSRASPRSRGATRTSGRRRHGGTG